MRIQADREVCVGSGQCVLTEPAVFDQSDDDGRVRLLAERPGPEYAKTVREAVDLCPSRALSLGEDEG
ncbi:MULTISPECIES: ferredoxin [Streptomyces]|uniref:Ferredoxin n=1 Tax=Streptomyces silvisoli TaxID=3034235 RepID=A0ABT5ZE14_9ACTN|nr:MULTISPECIES: ferredoxin [Streptomyces]MDF3288078.1 (4Fe-4S)-binding protein [Streptomyces silvisoli]